jgi:hypothetical protein
MVRLPVGMATRWVRLPDGKATSWYGSPMVCLLVSIATRWYG